MKTGIHTLTDLTGLSVGDTLVVERYHTGPQLADYWYKRPWRVLRVTVGTVRTIVVVVGMNKNHTDKTIGVAKSISPKMLEYAKIYKLTTTEDLEEWINHQRYQN